MTGIEAAIADGRIDPKGVIAVLAKTEGNGLVNDFSRGYATLVLQLLFGRFLPPEDVARICFVMSGGTEGGMARTGPLRACGRRWRRASGARHRPCAYARPAVRASRPSAAGRPGCGRRPHSHAGCRHYRYR